MKKMSSFPKNFITQRLFGFAFYFIYITAKRKYHSPDKGCVASPVKACAAVYMTVEGMTSQGRSLQETDCSDCANPSCVGVDDCSVDASLENLQEDPSFTEPVTTAPTEGSAGNDAPESGHYICPRSCHQRRSGNS